MTDGDTPDVGKNIVTYDEGCGDPEPDEAFEDIIHNEVTHIADLSTRLTELCKKAYLDTTMRSRLMWTQQKSPNCCLR